MICLLQGQTPLGEKIVQRNRRHFSSFLICFWIVWDCFASFFNVLGLFWDGLDCDQVSTRPTGFKSFEIRFGLRCSGLFPNCSQNVLDDDHAQIVFWIMFKSFSEASGIVT